jgi:hypothetical protein
MRPGEAIQEARKYLTDPLVRATGSAFSMMGELLARYHDPSARQGKRRPDSFYAWIASLYLEAVAAGSPSAVRDTATRLGPGYEPGFVRDALTRARKRKLLTRPDTPKRAGGELTQLGREALEQGRG